MSDLLVLHPTAQFVDGGTNNVMCLIPKERIYWLNVYIECTKMLN